MKSAKEITAALGGRWCGTYGLARCIGHDDKTPSMKISDKHGKDGKTRLDLHCFSGCLWTDLKAELVKRGLVEPFRATSLQVRHVVGIKANAAQKIAEKVMASRAAASVLEDERKRIGAALKLWDTGIPLAGTLGGSYLRVHRGCNFIDGAFDHCLRWHKGKQMIVARMGDPRTDIFTGVQRIFLDELGRRVGDRRMLGKAGIVRISPDEDVLEGLHIVEGIEDAIAAYVEDVRPVWAMVAANMITKFPVLDGIDALTIFPIQTTPAKTQLLRARRGGWKLETVRFVSCHYGVDRRKVRGRQTGRL